MKRFIFAIILCASIMSHANDSIRYVNAFRCIQENLPNISIWVSPCLEDFAIGPMYQNFADSIAASAWRYEQYDDSLRYQSLPYRMSNPYNYQDVIVAFSLVRDGSIMAQVVKNYKYPDYSHVDILPDVIEFYFRFGIDDEIIYSDKIIWNFVVPYYYYPICEDCLDYLQERAFPLRPIN